MIANKIIVLKMNELHVIVDTLTHLYTNLCILPPSGTIVWVSGLALVLLCSKHELVSRVRNRVLGIAYFCNSLYVRLKLG